MPESDATIRGFERKAPESDALSLEESAGKRCVEFGGKCRKAMR